MPAAEAERARQDRAVKHTVVEDVVAEESMMQSRLRLFGYTGVFCLAIGLVNWMVEPATPLWASLAVSFAIGWSINVAFVLLQARCSQWMSPYVAAPLITATGLCVGLCIGGVLVVGEPLYFFTDNYMTLVFGVFFGVVGFVIFSTRARLLAAQAELQAAHAQREHQERLLAQTELRLLQAQIEPHFLFNTLSNVAGLIHTDPDAAEQMLLNLTTLLRASLNRTRQSHTTLGQELEIARAYLDIHKTRLQQRLHYRIEHDPALDQVSLPPLIVQPLVENAVKHGIDPKEEGGTVIISTAVQGPFVEIIVADDGGGIGAGTPGNGAGLRNVRERLAALYDDASLTLVEAQHGIRAVIRLPLNSGQAG